jgi:hypothetical protein
MITPEKIKGMPLGGIVRGTPAQHGDLMALGE